MEFIHKNIIHLPNFLTKTFIQLETTDPFTVAKAFLNTIIDFDNASTDLDQEPDSVKDIINNEDLKDLQDPNDDEKSSSEHTLESSEMMQLRPKELIIKSSSQENLLHILQFCYLCVKGKITPILYSLSSNSDIENWFKSLPVPNISQINFIISHFSYSIINNSDPNESISRPEWKICQKDNYLINNMKKLHDMVGQNPKSKEDKDPHHSAPNHLPIVW